MAKFCENGKDHGNITVKTQHQVTGPKTIYNTGYKIQLLALTNIITCSGRVSFVKFCHCGVLKCIFL